MPTAARAPVPVAVVGAGAIGRAHIERALRCEDVWLSAVVDPFVDRDVVRRIAASTPVYRDLEAMLDRHELGAIIIATPNDSHVELAISAIKRGITVLIEKPLSNSLSEGARLCETAEAAGIPVLVGHHRRHNPVVQRARGMLKAGVIGRPVCATVMATWFKPEDYFDIEWRRRPGAGPIVINLIHDIDLLRYFFGEVVAVQAALSNRVRGFGVEDTATAHLRFECGALASLTLSDCAVSPWVWDLTAGEAEHYPQQVADAMFLSGTEASIALPSLAVWRYRGAKGWRQEMTTEHTAVHRSDPYMLQLQHLARVTRREVDPICSGRDGWRTLQVALAILEAADSGRTVLLGHLDQPKESAFGSQSA